MFKFIFHFFKYMGNSHFILWVWSLQYLKTLRFCSCSIVPAHGSLSVNCPVFLELDLCEFSEALVIISKWDCTSVLSWPQLGSRQWEIWNFTDSPIVYLKKAWIAVFWACFISFTYIQGPHIPWAICPGIMHSSHRWLSQGISLSQRCWCRPATSLPGLPSLCAL